MADGHLQPDYPIASINQKGVYRKDLGDLDTLAESMSRLGLLTPVVVTADGDLICGKRRLAAATQLGWTTIPAWTPAKVSKELRVFALFDDETLRKALTPTEQANLYGEYQALYAEQSRLRCEATRFTEGNNAAAKADDPPQNGVAESATPFHEAKEPIQDSRIKAAVAVTGTESHQRLEQIQELQAIAKDPGEHPKIQHDAAVALVELDADGKVNPRYQRVKLAQQAMELKQTLVDPDEAEPIQQAALDAIRQIGAAEGQTDKLKAARQGVKTITDLRANMPKPVKPVDPDAAQKRIAWLVYDLLRRENGWWDTYDPDVAGRYATDEQWQYVENSITAQQAWLQRGRNARAATAPAG